jgi:hypothetical protein
MDAWTAEKVAVTNGLCAVQSEQIVRVRRSACGHASSAPMAKKIAHDEWAMSFFLTTA